MLKAPHHTQVKQAEQLGLIVEADQEANQYVCRWPEGNRSHWGDDVKQLIEDMKNLKMAKKTYGLDCLFTKGLWYVRQGKKVLAKGADLWETICDALDTMAPEVEAQPVKPAKKQAPKVAVEDEDEDEDFEDEDLDDSDEPVEDEEEEEGEGGRSVVKAKYRRIYREKPIRNTCSDDFVVQLREYLETEILDDQGEFVRHGIDTEKLRRFAIANGLWDEKYARLNPGMQRMNVGNKLRGKQRKNPDWQPEWVA